MIPLKVPWPSWCIEKSHWTYQSRPSYSLLELLMACYRILINLKVYDMYFTGTWWDNAVITYWGTILTHWGRDKMVTISQTTISHAFSWIKMYECWLKCHWSLLPRVQLTLFHHWFRLPTHICVTRPQWVKPSAAKTGLFLEHYVNVMAADALNRWVGKASTAIWLIVNRFHNLGFEKWYRKQMNIHIFPEKISQKGLSLKS